MKRIALFPVTNLAVLVLLSIVVRALGLDVLLAQQGVGADGLLLLAAVVGFGGALVSLAMSKWTAKAMMGVRTIDRPQTGEEARLLRTVASHAERSRCSTARSAEGATSSGEPGRVLSIS